jgi:hypothetical protein
MIIAIIALMMEATSVSKTSVNFYQTTQRNIPEDSHRHGKEISRRRHVAVLDCTRKTR